MPSSFIQRILVAVKNPVGPTPPSIGKAAQLAGALNAELVLFHAIDVPRYAEAYSANGRGLRDDQERIRTHFLHNLTAQTAAIRGTGGSVSVAAEWDYPAHEAVLRYAQRIGADLIVTERHGHGARTPWALHSSDWELLRLSAKPVLVIKNPKPYRQPVVLAALDPPHRHAKPADLDIALCAWAQAVSSGLSGAWHAMHALSGIQGVAFERMYDSTIARKAADRVGANAAKAMDQLLESAAVKPRSVQLQGVPPARAIIESALDLNAALVVMGALSRSGLKRLLIGNTAEQVIDRICCDVLVVKPRQFGIHFSRRVRGAHMLQLASARPSD